MQSSEGFTNLMIDLEGEELVGYKDSAGKPTVGIGHLILSHEPYAVGKSITLQESRRLFANDTKGAVQAVNDLVKVPITQNMFDALCSFTFNLGRGTLAKSTLLQKINAKQFSVAATCFAPYCKEHVNGVLVTVKGLITRRAKEAALFSKK